MNGHSLVAPATRTTTAASRPGPSASQSERAATPTARGRARRCTACTSPADRVLEAPQQVGVLREPGEADRRPRAEEQQPTDARTRGPPSHRRVAASQTTSGHRKNFAASVTPRRPRAQAAVAKPPREGSGERERQRDVPGLNRRDHGRPEKHEPIAAPVAYAERRRGRERDENEERHDDHARDLERELDDWRGKQRRERRIRTYGPPQSAGVAPGGYGDSPSHDRLAAP